MRLLKTRSDDLEFAEFVGEEIPFYAILSHTWGDDEVSLQDGQKSRRGGTKRLSRRASSPRHTAFEYVWIDTCCIDKTSSAELSEAINSMHSWYQDAGVCYVYLADVHVESSPPSVPPSLYQSLARSRWFAHGWLCQSLAKSRWFTRGWTLQELIAPKVVLFFNSRWHENGTKLSLQSAISDITGIPERILIGGYVEGASVAQRMSWASRKTTRPEDMAYCLMGLFGINMPLLYGEGERAFTRLQEEIMRFSNDHSLFAWGMLDDYTGPVSPMRRSDYPFKSRLSLLARSLAWFSRSGGIVPTRESTTKFLVGRSHSTTGELT
ncbi:heterokaryon incompatibility protein-domain-containing protein [Lasiosphaeria hispida]|uniref:Heterokaryon incompatibility protein-domain-containing protein n=1 Tax=Lasiosphaeria hispida TaxID=260671 RepID=A0AAJ0H7Y2_9PEZI|nr:heterokaryon incompatibility protein-domain-containing protein [Lasiosphaeria hispida]